MPLPDRLYSALLTFMEHLQTNRAMLLDGRNTLASGATPFSRVVPLLDAMIIVRNEIIDLKSRPGIGTFARNVFGNQTIDVVAAMNTLQAQIENTVTTTRGLIPIDGNGFLLVFNLSAGTFDTPQFTWRAFSVGQSAGFRTQIDAVLAAIDDLYVVLQGAL